MTADTTLLSGETRERPPNLADARVAAEIIARLGATQVLLFGSVVHGTADIDSDIDLIAIYDNLDYENRYRFKRQLQAAAERACGRVVDVHVTDRPEWRWRVERVSSSQEAAVSPHAQFLIDLPPRSPVCWDKQIALAMSNLEQAESKLHDIQKALFDVEASIRPLQRQGLSKSLAETRNKERLRSLCGAASMTVETSIKAVRALQGQMSKRNHDLTKQLKGLAESSVAEVETIIDTHDADVAEMSTWRMAASFSDIDSLETGRRMSPEEIWESAERSCGRLVDVALEAVAWALREMQTGGSTSALMVSIAELAGSLSDDRGEFDLVTGEPLE